MGIVVEIEAFRMARARPGGDDRFNPDYAFFNEIEGRCPGCNARRSFIMAFHDLGTVAGTGVFSSTLPHFRCDGERVIEQEVPETPVPV